MSNPINLVYIDGEALNGLVEAGDSADRTVKAVMRNMTHDQQKTFVYWLEQAHKEAKRTLHDGEIARFAEGVKEEHRKHPLGERKYEVNGKVYTHQREKKKSEAPPSLLDMFDI